MIWLVLMQLDLGESGEPSAFYGTGLAWEALVHLQRLTGRRVPAVLTRDRRVAHYAQPAPDIAISGTFIAQRIDEPEWWNKTLEQAQAELGL